MIQAKHFFQVGGTLSEDAPSYIERPADTELQEALARGELCLVLAPRQTGKSSLMVHVLQALRQKDVRIGVADLQQLGGQREAAQWFADVLDQLERGLKLKTDALDWWDEHDRLGATQRFLRFLEEVVLAECPGNIVIFFDEIDSVLNLPFADDFFTTLRAFYNARAMHPDFKRLSFVLLGVATPSDFIKERTRTPFNIGTAIPLLDFDSASAGSFRAVLGDNGEALMERIFHWSGGQPLLTQSLAAAAAAWPAAERDAARLDAEVESGLFKAKIKDNPHLNFIQDYLLGDKALLRPLLKTYRRVLRGGKPVAEDKQSPVQERLKLAGVVRAENGKLWLRNRIYAGVFGPAWMKLHWPSDLQRMALYAVGIVLALGLNWVFLFQPLFFPKFPQQERFVRYSPEPSVTLQIPLSNSNVSRVVLEREDNGETQTIYQADSVWQPRQQDTVNVTLGSLAVGEYTCSPENKLQRPKDMEKEKFSRSARICGKNTKPAHRLAFYAGWPEQARTIPLETVYYPNWEVRWFPDKRLNSLTPIIEVEDNTIRLKEIMDGHDMGPPKYEWDEEKQERVEKERTLKMDAPITALRPAEDYRYLLAGDESGQVRLWQLNMTDPEIPSTRKINPDLRQSFFHPAAVGALAISPDRQMVLSAHADGAVWLWRVQDGKALHRFEHQGMSVVDFAPDGKTLLIGDESGALHLYRHGLAGWQKHSLAGELGAVTAARFGPNGLIAGAGAEGSLILWSNQEKAPQRLKPAAPVTALAFSPDGKSLFSGTENGGIILWNTADGGKLRDFQMQGAITRLRFAPNGRVFYAQSDEAVRVWDSRDGKEIGVYKGHQGIAAFVAFSPDGNRLASTGKSNFKLWEVHTGKESGTFKRHAKGYTKVVFSSDGGKLLFGNIEDSGETANTVELWDAHNGKFLRSFYGHKDNVVGIAFSPNRAWIASASEDKTIKLWDATTGQEIRSFNGHENDVYDVRFSSDGKRLASASSDKTIKLWDVNNGQILRTLHGHESAVVTVRFLPSDNSRLLSCSEDKTLKLWDLNSGEVIRNSTGHENDVIELAVSPSGRFVVSSSKDKTAKLWDIHGGQLLRTFSGHQETIFGTAYSPDGRYIATASLDGTVRLWWAGIGEQ
ncbi:MAG: hypothetical protein GY862_14440 [Gammaproteobacteria bacterium]|nr:hypothetical protein [Gammaproteobacteria bacterium]